MGLSWVRNFLVVGRFRFNPATVQEGRPKNSPPIHWRALRISDFECRRHD